MDWVTRWCKRGPVWDECGAKRGAAFYFLSGVLLAEEVALNNRK